MKKFYLLTTFLCCLFLQQSTAQERYIDEVFTEEDITVMKDVNYGTNMSILAKLFVEGIDVPTPEMLKADVHMPSASVDSETSRPVVLLLVGDNALPRYAQTCYGAADDLYMTTLAGTLSRRGYVVMVVKMRVGWNPLVTAPNDFVRELSDGVIRQSQDAKAAARFLRKDVAESGNTFGIDPNKILLWGSAQGAGTIAWVAAYTKTEAEFQSQNFIVQNEAGELVNVYDPVLFGNVDGTEPGFEPAGALSNLPSQTGCYDSDFNMVVTAGGVWLDTFMIQAGETPMVHFTAGDWLAAGVPAGPLNLPASGDFCCLVTFGHTYQKQADRLGILDEWKGIEFANPIANTRLDDPVTPDVVDPIEGMYAIGGEASNQFPWVYWDEAGCEAVSPAAAAATKQARAGASMENMLAATEEMMAYALPRACITLDLGCNAITTGLREEIVESERIAVSPNPSTGFFTFETPTHTMEAISIYNIAGKLMYQTAVSTDKFTTNNLDLADGMYIAKIKFEDGIASKKIVVGE